jgi:NADP-dependent 3-hydroxy acid dehydrogenase YdfG
MSRNKRNDIMKSKIALATGASSGIAETAAERLQEPGTMFPSTSRRDR